MGFRYFFYMTRLIIGTIPFLKRKKNLITWTPICNCVLGSKVYCFLSSAIISSYPLFVSLVSTSINWPTFVWRFSRQPIHSTLIYENNDNKCTKKIISQKINSVRQNEMKKKLYQEFSFCLNEFYLATGDDLPTQSGTPCAYLHGRPVFSEIENCNYFFSGRLSSLLIHFFFTPQTSPVSWSKYFGMLHSCFVFLLKSSELILQLLNWF